MKNAFSNYNFKSVPNGRFQTKHGLFSTLLNLKLVVLVLVAHIEISAQTKTICGSAPIPSGYVVVNENSNGCKTITNTKPLKPGAKITICSSASTPPSSEWIFVEDDPFIPCNTIKGKKLYRRVILKIAGLAPGNTFFTCTKYSSLPPELAMQDITSEPCLTTPFGAKYYRKKLVVIKGYKPGSVITIISSTPKEWFTQSITQYFGSYYKRKVILLAGTKRGFTFQACSGDKQPSGFRLDYLGGICDAKFNYRARTFVKTSNLMSDDNLETRALAAKEFSISPNPTVNQFVIKRLSIDDKSDYSIQVYDNSGKRYMNLFWKGNDTEIKLGDDLHAGNYYIKITAQDGTSRVMKVVKI